jgi:hypothetical protein
MKIKNNKVVYLHIRKDTNEVFYVGIGNTKRPYSKRNRNEYWKNIVNKCGYDVKILYTNLDWQTACSIEIELIKKYGRKDLGEGTLVNNTNGGDGTNGAILSDKTKKRMSESRIGKTHSDETKQKMSKSAIGNTASFGIVRSDEYKSKLSKIQKEVNRNIEVRIKKSNSLKNYTKTKEHCNNISKSKKGISQPISFVEKRGTSVLQYDLVGNLLNEFLSLRRASDSSGISRHYINQVCDGKRESYMGFIWKYK